MRRAGIYLRWAAIAVYSAAVLGALIVPHGHGLIPGGCCDSDACHDCQALLAKSTSSCQHAHGSCSHGHSHASHAALPPASEEFPADQHDSSDCAYCRFLAQPAQTAAAPILATLHVALAAALTPSQPLGCRLVLSTPPVRGPPRT